MKMKRIINTLLCIAALFIAASCLQEEIIAEMPVNESIILDLSSGITKASHTSTEAYVDKIDVFIFNMADGKPDNLITHETFSVNNTSKVILDAKRTEFTENQEYFVYLLANRAGKAVDAQLVTTDVAEVNLTLRIARVKEIALKLNVIDGGGATAQNSVITIDPPTILISGSDALLEGMEQLELGAVDLVY